MYAPKFAELEATNNEEVKDAYDRAAEDTKVGPEFVLTEMTRRDQGRQTKSVIWLTWAITALTFVNAGWRWQS